MQLLPGAAQAPFCKMVRKAFTRLLLADCLRSQRAGQPLPAGVEAVIQLLDELGGSAATAEPLDRRLEAAAAQASTSSYERMAEPGTLLGSECGNMYSGLPPPFICTWTACPRLPLNACAACCSLAVRRPRLACERKRRRPGGQAPAGLQLRFWMRGLPLLRPVSRHGWALLAGPHR